MPRKWIYILCALVVFAGVLPAAGGAETAGAASDAPRRSSLGDLLELAYARNPEIRAAREAWRAAVEEFRIVTGYPNPQVMGTYFPEPIETRLGPQDWNITLQQPIPFPGKLSQAGEVAAIEARIAKLNLDIAVRDTLTAVRQSFHELWYIRRAGEIAVQNMELLQHIRQVGESAYAENEAVLLDVVEAQSQAAQLSYDILLLEDLEETEITRINGLLDRAPRAPIGEMEDPALPPLAYELSDLYQTAEIHHEEIRMAREAVNQAGERIDLARYAFLPEFKVGLFYASIGRPDVSTLPEDAGRDAVGFQFGFDIPLWFGKNKSQVAKARAEKATAEARAESRVNLTRTRIRQVFFKLENARRLIELYRNELIPQALKAMEIAETWFQEGEGSFSDYIETQSVVYNFQLASARAGADYGKLLAELEGLVGKTVTQSPRPEEKR